MNNQCVGRDAAYLELDGSVEVRDHSGECPLGIANRVRPDLTGQALPSRRYPRLV